MDYLDKSIALVLGSDLNNSTERSFDDMQIYFCSKNIHSEIFVPDIPYFHSYLFNIIKLFRIKKRNIYTRPSINIIAYIIVKIYLLIRRHQSIKYLFSIKPNYYKSYKKLDLSNFDYVITHCTYLLPFIKSKSPPIITLNADYFHQQKASHNSNWWRFCIQLLSDYRIDFFVNSDSLHCIYSSHQYKILGIIPDGPSFKDLSYIVRAKRKFLLIYSHTSNDKGINCLDTESISHLHYLKDNEISLLGSDLICSKKFKFNNYGALPYSAYLNKLNEYKIFLYLSNSDSFESPPIEALLSGCIVISSKTPAALYYSQFTKRVILLESVSKTDLKDALSIALQNYTHLSVNEFKKLYHYARKHSAFEGAKRYLLYIEKISKKTV